LNILHGPGSFQQRWEWIVCYVDLQEADDFKASLDGLVDSASGATAVPSTAAVAPAIAVTAVEPSASSSAAPGSAEETSPSKRALSADELTRIELNKAEALAKRAKRGETSPQQKDEEIFAALHWVSHLCSRVLCGQGTPLFFLLFAGI
jgi:hypothetical protein